MLQNNAICLESRQCTGKVGMIKFTLQNISITLFINWIQLNKNSIFFDCAGVSKLRTEQVNQINDFNIFFTDTN